MILGSGRTLGEGNGNPLQYSCLKVPRTEEPGGLQSMGLQRVACDLATKHAQAHSIYISIYTYSSIYVLCFPKLYVEIIIEKYTRKRNCLVCILYDLYLFIYFFICSRFLSYIAMKQPWVYMCSPSQSPLYAEQKKRHRFIEQSFRLCRRRRGWDVSREQH